MGTRIPILITGAGSELAFGIIKACRASQLPLQLFGIDADSDALGLQWVDRAIVVPRADQEPETYLQTLRTIVHTHRIQAILPTADVELELLPKVRDEFLNDLGCWIMINRPAEMKRFGDKWQAHRWFFAHTLPTPATVRADRDAELDDFLATVSFPVVVKPRRGGGSRHLFVAKNRDELDRLRKMVPQPIAQPRVGTEQDEFTAGTFRTLHDEIHCIVLQRQLKFGMTYKAKVVHDRELTDFCADVIRNTNLEGVNNIQFRRTADGPVILEINPRFSGTTGIRAHFGFNEPEMVIRQYVLGLAPPTPKIVGGSVLRYMNESFSPALRPARVDMEPTI